MNQSLKKRMQEERFYLTSIDLFSGPGGLCTGFKWGGILPLIAVEWCDTTAQTYSINQNAEIFELNQYIVNGTIDREYLSRFKKESVCSLLVHGDINLVETELIRELLYSRYGIDSEHETVDIVSGGAPCESFSMAGTRTAGDSRDVLFNNIIRISRGLQAKSILFENVKGLFSKSVKGVKGAIFKDICAAFNDKTVSPSYRLVSTRQDEILLTACDYGVPQRRERLFLVAIRSDLDSVKFHYPQKLYGDGCAKAFITSGEAIGDLPAVAMGVESTEYIPTKQYQTENQKWFVSVMRGTYSDETMNTLVPIHLRCKEFFPNSLSCHKGPGHTKKKQALLALIHERESMRSAYNRLVECGEIEKFRQFFPNTIYGSRNRRLLADEPSFTVTSHCLDEILHPYLNRAITPREAARLQSFPDWYHFVGPYVVFHGATEQDKYEQIGDAIPPLLAFALAREFIRAFGA